MTITKFSQFADKWLKMHAKCAILLPVNWHVWLHRFTVNNTHFTD